LGLGISSCGEVRETPDADPRRIYHNIVVVIDAQRNLNNGHPGTLAAWLDRLEIAPGEHVFLVGAGLGYYTAILSELVGEKGRVTAIEVDAGINAALGKQIASPKVFSVQSLRRDTHAEEETCWLHGKDFCFSQRSLD
jgi:protein-L-isoaspartate O-methyltransferase